MDLETANKINDLLKPIGYTVGKIHYELSQYETAIKIVNDEMRLYVGDDYEAGYNKRKYIENELTEVLPFFLISLFFHK